MAIVVLLVTVVVGFWLTSIADAFPQVLWGWFNGRSWLTWLVLLTLFSWGMKGDDTP